MNWFCSSVLSFKSYKSKDSNVERLKYYLPRENSEIQSQYKIIFRLNGFNWNDGHIAGKKKHNSLGKPIDSHRFKMPCLNCLVFSCVYGFFSER